MADKTEIIRNKRIVSNFTPQEMEQVEELRTRLNINTYGKLVRVILLAVARNPEFVFLASKITLGMTYLRMSEKILH